MLLCLPETDARRPESLPIEFPSNCWALTFLSSWTVSFAKPNSTRNVLGEMKSQLSKYFCWAGVMAETSSLFRPSSCSACPRSSYSGVSRMYSPGSGRNGGATCLCSSEFQFKSSKNLCLLICSSPAGPYPSRSSSLTLSSSRIKLFEVSDKYSG